MRETVHLCVDSALEMSGPDAAGIYLVEPEIGLELVAHKGLSDEFVREVSYLDPTSPHACSILKGRLDYQEHREIEGNFKLLREREGLRGLWSTGMGAVSGASPNRARVPPSRFPFPIVCQTRRGPSWWRPPGASGASPAVLHVWGLSRTVDARRLSCEGLPRRCLRHRALS
jgi:hypothetical protein